NFRLKFQVKIPYIFSRFGHIGHHYECTQWYPKIVVYDRKGWHPDGYHLIGEFYGDFGTFDVSITVPQNMTVAATGDLVAPKSEIMRLDSLARWGTKLDSLRDAKNLKAVKKFYNQLLRSHLSAETKTLTFHAENVHDFAWVADGKFILKRGQYQNTTINVFVLPAHEAKGKDAIKYAYDTLEHYGKCYLPYPYNQVSVVDGDISAGAGMEYPNLTIVQFNSPDWLRQLEMVIMHEIGHNWFYGILGNNEMAEAWLDEGMNSFAEVRYLEDKYGREGNMTNWPEMLSFLPQLDDRYIHSAMYYLFAASQAEQKVLTPAYQFKESYVLVYGKGAWIMNMLRDLVGKETFDDIMHTYFAKYRFKHPTTEDFIAVCEEISGRPLKPFFDSWLRSTQQCDLTIKKIQKHKLPTGQKELLITVAQQKSIDVPATLSIENRDGSKIYRRWHATSRDTTFKLTMTDWPKVVWIDPYDNILEVDNWNNRVPRRIGFRPILDLPSLDSYHIYYGPTAWYDDDVDGPRVGFYANGGQFRDGNGFKGRYQWSLKAAYGFRSEKLSYAVGFKHPLEWLGNSARLELKARDYEGEKYGSVGLKWRWSHYVTRKPEWQFQLRYFYQRMYNLDYLNVIDWTRGVTSGAAASLAFASGHYRFPMAITLNSAVGLPQLKSDFNFQKVSVEIKQQQKWTRQLVSTVRVFCGYLRGEDNPGQHHLFYLAGGLVPAGPLAFMVDGRGRYSPQNYYFVEGDGNMRGYYRQHLAGRAIATMNFSLKMPYLPLSLFYDIGNVWPDWKQSASNNLRQDAGLELDLKVLKFHFPVWLSHPPIGEKKMEYRWLVNLNTALNINLGF
ncbi:MAG: M1 family metallopeptidase, partial [candidate division KSB1 bacterium]|nr:M1 family metallopeptidase [candidate division KSB1 bacterium]